MSWVAKPESLYCFFLTTSFSFFFLVNGLLSYVLISMVFEMLSFISTCFTFITLPLTQLSASMNLWISRIGIRANSTFMNFLINFLLKTRIWYQFVMQLQDPTQVTGLLFCEFSNLTLNKIGSLFLPEFRFPSQNAMDRQQTVTKKFKVNNSWKRWVKGIKQRTIRKETLQKSNFIKAQRTASLWVLTSF